MNAPAEVLWDSWGIPHVYTQDAHDAFLLQGYLHAQDRLWQMELRRRIAAGRLSEIFGARTLEADRFLRRVGLHRVAAAEAAAQTGAAAAMLDAYCEGVNWYIRSGRRPLEFGLLGLRPEPWSPADCLAWAKLMSWGIGLNWDAELYRAHVAARSGVQAATSLEWPYPDSHPLTATPGLAQHKTAPIEPLVSDILKAFSPGQGSNGWVIAPQRTSTGGAILANDPHLLPQLPSSWYEMHLECADFCAAGASLPGAPGIIIGHNQAIAWGITASMVDTQDVFVEEFVDGEPHTYLVDGRPRVAETHREVIRVRGRAEPVVEEVEQTGHGPLLFPREPGQRYGLTLASTLLQPTPIAEAALALLRARDWDTFVAALARWQAPSVNFLYADTSGNIGYQLAGAVPRRKHGTGIFPTPGWTSAYDWAGMLRQDEKPFAFNPAEGYLANANNKPMPDGSGPYIHGEWIDGFRAQRIIDMILASSRHDLASVQAMHLDVLSLPALALQQLLQDIEPSSQELRAALNELRAWDGRVLPQSRAAALYEALKVRLFHRVLAARLGANAADYFGATVHPLGSTVAHQFRGVSRLLGLLNELTDDARRAVIVQCLEEALADLRGRSKGREIPPWGALHRVTFIHPLAAVPVLRRLLNLGPYPLRGDGDTLLQAGYDLSQPYEATRWFPSYRFIADTADWDRCLAVHPPGQSGDPASPHYDDMIGPWLRGEYHPMPFSRPAVEAAATARQIFMPV